MQDPLKLPKEYIYEIKGKKVVVIRFYKQYIDEVRKTAVADNYYESLDSNNHTVFSKTIGNITYKYTSSGAKGRKSGKQLETELEGSVYLKLCSYLKQEPFNSKDVEVAKKSLDREDIDQLSSSEADHIIKLFKLKPKTYIVLWAEPEYKKIRDFAHTLAKKSGFTAQVDKWNPADLFVVKKNKYKKIFNLDNISDVNAYISKFDDIIGISLKKGVSNSVKGSAGFGTIYSAVFQKKIAAISGTLKSLIIEKSVQFKALFSRSSALKKITYFRVTPEIFAKYKKEGKIKFSEILYSEIPGYKATPTNIKSQFYLKHFIFNMLYFSDKDLDNAATLMYNICKSKLPLSCDYYLEQNSTPSMNNIVHNVTEEQKLEKIFIDCNGFGKIFFKTDKHNMQMRNKGTIQFEINAIPNDKNIIPANKVEFDQYDFSKIK